MRGIALMRRTAAGLAPADDDAMAQLARLEEGDEVLVRLDRPRSLPQQRLYWAVLDHVAAATEWESARKLHNALRVKLGRYDIETMRNGKAAVVLDSTAFDKMPADEFTKYFDEAMREICVSLLGGMAVADLIAEVCAATGTPLPERRVA